jgi:hypothetical protein
MATMEAMPTAAMATMEAMPTTAMATAAMPTATPRVPWDDTGAEHYGQDEDAPHPLLAFPSPLMPAIHGMLLYPYAHDHSPGLLLSPAAHSRPNAICTASLG